MTTLTTILQDVLIKPEGNRQVIINRMTGEEINSVSNKYTLIPNKEVFQPFIDHFGVDRISGVACYGAGKYAMMKINTGRTFNLGTNTAPDILKEQVIIQNSYNLTRAFKIMIGAFRQVCLNGMYSGHMETSFRAVHTGNINYREVIDNAIANYTENNFSTWYKMRDKVLSLQEQADLVNQFNAFDVEKETGSYNQNNNAYINKRIQLVTTRLLSAPESVDNARNGWGLYNQFNRAIASTVTGRSNINKVILGNKNAENFLINKLNLN